MQLLQRRGIPLDVALYVAVIDEEAMEAERARQAALARIFSEPSPSPPPSPPRPHQ